MTIEARKYHLIEGIMQVSDEGAIEKLEQILKEYAESRDSIRHLLKPMKQKLDVDQLVEEQNFQGVNTEKIEQLIKEINLEEPIEDLLEMI